MPRKVFAQARRVELVDLKLVFRSMTLAARCVGVINKNIYDAINADLLCSNWKWAYCDDPTRPTDISDFVDIPPLENRTIAIREPETLEKLRRTYIEQQGLVKVRRRKVRNKRTMAIEEEKQRIFANKQAEERARYRRRAIAELMVEGVSAEDIANTLGVTVKSIIRDIEHIRTHWNSTLFKDIVEWKMMIMAQTREVQELALEEFKRSRTKVTRKRGVSGDKTSEESTTVEQAGDSAFLNVAVSCLNLQAKVLNLADAKEESQSSYKQFLADLASTVEAAKTTREEQEELNRQQELDQLLSIPTGSLIEAKAVEVESNALPAEVERVVERKPVTTNSINYEELNLIGLLEE